MDGANGRRIGGARWHGADDLLHAPSPPTFAAAGEATAMGLTDRGGHDSA